MTHLRVSTNYTYIRSLRDIKTSQDNYLALQEKLVTGQEINKPKDDPVGIQQVLNYTNRIGANEQYQRNIDYSQGLLQVTSSTLQSIEDLLMDIKQIAQDYKTSVVTSAERASVATTVESLLEELVQLANTKYAGKFIFGGTNTLSGTAPGSSPFNITEDADGYITAVTRNARGIDDLIYREVREGHLKAVNLSGSAAFMPNGEGLSGDIFQVVMDLRDNLRQNNIAALETDINLIQDGIDQVLQQDVKVGVRQNSFEIIRDQLTNENINNKDIRSKINDIDYAALMIEFNTAQTLLQTTLQSAAQLMQLSLVNFL
ncbi:MAG: flagellar hook-associated protein FlgL [Candidatus Omnitrophica bacterium]|nr:flagellar hook-associated protein FlgL [Candidatus Omnitrophota bacterium]